MTNDAKGLLATLKNSNWNGIDRASSDADVNNEELEVEDNKGTNQSESEVLNSGEADNSERVSISTLKRMLAHGLADTYPLGADQSNTGRSDLDPELENEDVDADSLNNHLDEFEESIKRLNPNYSEDQGDSESGPILSGSKIKSEYTEEYGSADDEIDLAVPWPSKGGESKTPMQVPHQGSPTRSTKPLRTHVTAQFEELHLVHPNTKELLACMYPTIEKNLENVPDNQIHPPDIAIAGPILDAVKYVTYKPLLVELYANLMSSAMNAETARFAHPGFIASIRNLNSDEARVIRYLAKVRAIPVIDIKKVILDRQSEVLLKTLLSTVAVDAGCEHGDLAEMYLANLERTGIVTIHRDVHLTDKNIYDRILNAPGVKNKLKELNSSGINHRGEVNKYYAKLSVYGLQLCIASFNTK